MRNKIIMFAVLLSLLVGFALPGSQSITAKADDVQEYTFDRWCSDNGYKCVASSSETNADYPFEHSDDNIYVYLSDGRLIKMYYKSYIKLLKWGSSTTFCVYNTYSDYRTLSIQFYQYDTDGWIYCGYSATKYIHGGHDIPLNDYNVVLSDVVYTSVDIYEDYDFDTVLIPKTQRVYSFEKWCSDAGLSCSATSNESDAVVPFWYEPDNYNYIVRKTLTASSTSEVYQVTMLQKADGSHYPYYFEVNDIGYLGIAGAFSDTAAFTVRNFNYDTGGNGWKLVEKYDVSTLPFDNANVSFTDEIVFIYSDCDIYADREATAIWQSASTGYYNVDIPEPEITKTPIPSPGIDGVEGFVDTAEGLLDMISVVPLMIGAVFGFLPSWCLAIVGIAFSLLIALVVYKLARG